MTENRKKLVEPKNASLILNEGKKNEVETIGNISPDIYEGEIFGLAGESGSGKATVGRAILKLYDINKGKIDFDDETISHLKRKELHEFHRNAQIIFQDPQTSLNGCAKIRDIIVEGFDIHKLVNSKEERGQKAQDLLTLAGPNKDHSTRYPHEFPGRQRQRIGIVRALTVEPKFIIADEPTSVFDVSIRVQVVNLTQKLQGEQGSTYFFIAHDLSMVKYISDRIGAMYWGKIFEIETPGDVYNHPIHSYIKSLLIAIPEPGPESERNRIHEEYDPGAEPDDQPREMREITPGHFVLCTEVEVEAYKQES